MVHVGIDVGSITTKAVLWRDGQWQWVLRPSGYSPKTAAREALSELLSQAGVEDRHIGGIVATGYGRQQVGQASKTITEITCHARGAHYLVPGTDMVIDIGGQDSKVIKTDGAGGVTDFAMNDKCAAGTGRFLEVMAGALETGLDRMAELARGTEPAEITSMCTVFAESEVISKLAGDTPRAQVAAGIHHSIARRVAAMAQRLGLGDRTAFTGGVAKNQGVAEAMEKILGQKIIVAPHCQLAGALGAAILARE